MSLLYLCRCDDRFYLPISLFHPITAVLALICPVSSFYFADSLSIMKFLGLVSLHYSGLHLVNFVRCSATFTNLIKVDSVRLAWSVWNRLSASACIYFVVLFCFRFEFQQVGGLYLPTRSAALFLSTTTGARLVSSPLKLPWYSKWCFVRLEPFRTAWIVYPELDSRHAAAELFGHQVAKRMRVVHLRVYKGWGL